MSGIGGNGETRVMRRLHELFAERARRVRVTDLVLGLGYTAVATDDGGLGLAYTWFTDKTHCSFWRGWDDVEGGLATRLLDRLLSDDGVDRGVGLAMVNALNRDGAASLPTDESQAGALVNGLRIGRGSRVSMVGCFPPVARALRGLGAEVDMVDAGRSMGDERAFREQLGDRADALILTSTTLLGGTTEELLGCAGPRVRVALLGPSTPLVPEAFAGLPVDVLAGMVPSDAEQVLRLVRHGAGTPELQRHSRKVFWRRAQGEKESAA